MTVSVFHRVLVHRKPNYVSIDRSDKKFSNETETKETYARDVIKRPLNFVELFLSRVIIIEAHQLIQERQGINFKLLVKIMKGKNHRDTTNLIRYIHIYLIQSTIV